LQVRASLLRQCFWLLLFFADKSESAFDLLSMRIVEVTFLSHQKAIESNFEFLKMSTLRFTLRTYGMVCHK